MSLHLKLSLHFKISNFDVRRCLNPTSDDTAILNPVNIFRTWCKLNFRAMQGQFKSHHFSE